MTELEAAQSELLVIASELEGLGDRLESLRASVPPTFMELDPEYEPDEMDAPTEVRSVVECVLHDWLGPAIRDLRAAAVYPRTVEEALEAKEPLQRKAGAAGGMGDPRDDDETWDETPRPSSGECRGVLAVQTK